MDCYNKCGQLKQSTCPVCGKPFILPVGSTKNYKYVVEDKNKANYGKRYYCCSYECYKQKEYENILQKEKLTKNDVNWLIVHELDVPIEKAPKWMQKELQKEGKKRNGF